MKVLHDHSHVLQSRQESDGSSTAVTKDTVVSWALWDRRCPGKLLNLETTEAVFTALESQIAAWMSRRYVYHVTFDREEVQDLHDDLLTALTDSIGWLLKIETEQLASSVLVSQRLLPFVQGLLTSGVSKIVAAADPGVSEEERLSSTSDALPLLSFAINIFIDVIEFMPAHAASCSETVSQLLLQLLHVDVDLASSCIYGLGCCAMSGHATFDAECLAAVHALLNIISDDTANFSDADADTKLFLKELAICATLKLCLYRSSTLDGNDATSPSLPQLLEFSLTQLPLTEAGGLDDSRRTHGAIVSLVLTQDPRLWGINGERTALIRELMFKLHCCVDANELALVNIKDPIDVEEFWSKQLVSETTFSSLHSFIKGLK